MINIDKAITDCFICNMRTTCIETIIYDYQSGGIIEKIRSWLCLDCLESWRSNWSNNSLYHKERSVDDQEVLTYNDYLDQRIKDLKGYLYS